MKLKIVLIGAGSISFGRGTLADIFNSKEIESIDTTIYLVDINKSSLNRIYKLANLFKEYFKSNIKIKATTNRIEALKNADFVITSVAKKRYELWEQDFKIPLSYGFKHCLGENGGPGALFHALRNFEIMIPIAVDMEKLCPSAFLLNYTNPESRVVMAIRNLTSIQAIGLCHGAIGCLYSVCGLLNKKYTELEMVTGGLNHFLFLTKVIDKKTGKDLYPTLRKIILNNPKSAPPLVRKMVEIFGLYTYPSDDHIGEYLSFAYHFTGTKWRYGRGFQKQQNDFLSPYLKGIKKIDNEILHPTCELAIPIILDIVFDRKKWEYAVNVPNDKLYVENLPRDAIVEVPAIVDRKGIHPQKIGALPEALACYCRTQISIQKLIVEAYKKKSKNLLLQALLLDPVVNNVEKAEKMLDKMLKLQSSFLPKFN